ncbi:hypothetical protein [Psychroserpens sp. SPM9]|uniref:hypothetical protein n=1 Tax=Psychroserpens sp. SPM9 TaxID=2975598 RepID=UPI0021A5BD3E|nr:hypothetical protein [Psychroserpens sp. SPM9]MDG5492425.1 hypothetical protein [Psychroserpens sp. SPM9]
MKVFILPFAKITLLHKSIAEVVINDDVIMDAEMVEVYHDFLLSNLVAPFSLLINKEHAYSYTFDAQVKIANLKEINCMAVVLYNFSAEMGTKVLIDLNKGNNWNIKIFREREEALDWLKFNQNNKSAM